MNYEKSHNLLLHTIHYNLKKISELYLDEQEQIFEQHQANHKSVYVFTDAPYELKLTFNHHPDIVVREETHRLLDLLYPVLPLARENFPEFKYLFDWIEQSKPDGEMNPESCWCLGCKGNRLIQFEERPSLGVAPAIVPLGEYVPASDFKLAKDHIKEEDERSEADFEKYLHDEVCSINGNPCCKPCKEKLHGDFDLQEKLQQAWRDYRKKEDNQIIKKLMQWSSDLFNCDKVGFKFKELFDGFQAGNVELFYDEGKDWRDRSPDVFDKYLFHVTITHTNFDEVMAKHTPLAKAWFEKIKNEEMLSPSQERNK